MELKVKCISFVSNVTGKESSQYVLGTMFSCGLIHDPVASVRYKTINFELYAFILSF